VSEKEGTRGRGIGENKGNSTGYTNNTLSSLLLIKVDFILFLL
jgi:hypothetical protein